MSLQKKMDEETGKVTLKENRIITKLSNCLPAFWLYGTLVSLFFFLFFDLHWVYYILITLAVFNLYIIGYVAWYSQKGIFLVEQNMKERNFRQKFQAKAEQLKGKVLEGQKLVSFDDVQHFIIVATYHETKELVAETLRNIAKSSIAKGQIHIVIACEVREKGSKEKGDYLVAQFSNYFKSVSATYHPINLPGELAGKGSNVDWAMSRVREIIAQDNIDTNCACITVSDSDSVFTPTHFDYLAYEFATEPARHLKIWQAPIINVQNFFDCTAITKFLGLSASAHDLACAGDQSCELISFSTYSFSFEFLELIGGHWGKNVVSEDWRIFLKSFYDTNGLTCVAPLYQPVFSYAIVSNTYTESLVERFHQAKRHAWGVQEVCYFLNRFLHVLIYTPNNLNMKYLIRFIVIFCKMIKLHYFGGITFVMLVFPKVIELAFALFPSIATEEAFLIRAYYMPIFDIINAITTIPVLMVTYTNYKMFVMKHGAENVNLATFLIETIKMAIVALPSQLVYCTIPSFFAATRLVFTDQFKFVVAPKPSLSQDSIKTLEERT